MGKLVCYDATNGVVGAVLLTIVAVECVWGHNPSYPLTSSQIEK